MMMMLVLKTRMMIVYMNSDNYHYDCDDDENGVVKTLMKIS